MRKFFQIKILLAFCLLFTFCKKEEEVPPSPVPDYVQVHSACDTSYGHAIANKLTAGWKAGVSCRSYWASGKKYWLVELTTCASDGSLRESLMIGGMPDYHAVQTFQVEQPAVALSQGSVGAFYGTLADDGDVAEDYYKLDTTKTDNYFVIDKWDIVAKRAEGRFQVSFNIREPRRNLQNPKKVTFSSGKFWAKLPD
jgi:hypothetical protein